MATDNNPRFQPWVLVIKKIPSPGGAKDNQSVSWDVNGKLSMNFSMRTQSGFPDLSTGNFRTEDSIRSLCHFLPLLETVSVFASKIACPLKHSRTPLLLSIAATNGVVPR